MNNQWNPNQWTPNPWSQFADPATMMRYWTQAWGAMMTPFVSMMQAGWGMNPYGPPGQSAANMFNAWAGMTPGRRPNPLQPEPPAAEPSWAIGEDDDDDDDDDDGDVVVRSGGPDRGGLGVALELGRAKVTLVLDSSEHDGPLELGNLTSMDGVELPIASDAVALDGGRVAVRLGISDDQPPGFYSGSIFDGSSGRPLGRIDVQVAQG
jgi:hypothetical protein